MLVEKTYTQLKNIRFSEEKMSPSDIALQVRIKIFFFTQIKIVSFHEVSSSLDYSLS